MYLTEIPTPWKSIKKIPIKLTRNGFYGTTKGDTFIQGRSPICLLYLHDDKWLLTTIKRIVKELDVVDNVGFEANEIDVYRKYFGRLVLKYHNTKRGMGRTYMSIMVSWR